MYHLSALSRWLLNNTVRQPDTISVGSKVTCATGLGIAQTPTLFWWESSIQGTVQLSTVDLVDVGWGLMWLRWPWFTSSINEGFVCLFVLDLNLTLKSTALSAYLQLLKQLGKCICILENDILKINRRALAGVAQWIKCYSVNQRVAGLIPSGGTCLGCGPGSLWGSRERQPHKDVSLPLFLPPLPSL